MRYWFLFFLFLFFVLRSSAGVFDIVRSVPASGRIARTQEIYNKQVKLADSVFAIASLEQLIAIANQINDKQLQCFSISLLADQYARTRSANDLSAQLHHEAISLAENYRLPLMMGICNYRMGRYYYNFKNYPVAFEYLLRADNYFLEMGYKEVPDIDEILFFIGSIYYETGNYDRAETFLLNLQQQKKISDYIRKQSLNTLALIKKQQNDTNQALNWFGKTLAEAIRQNDSTWLGISYSNIGALYFSTKQFDKAYPLLERAGRINILHKQLGDAYRDLLSLASIDLMHNNTALGKRRIDSATALHSSYFTVAGRKHLYETLSLYYEKTNQQAKALAAERELVLVKDSLAISKDQQTYKKIQLRMETEKHLSDIDKLETEAKESAVKRNGVIALLVLAVIVLLLLYNRYRLKANNNAALLRTEKLYAEEQLKNARQLLQNFTENTRQKNALIEKFAAELERLKRNLPGDPVYEERLKNFEKLVQSTTLTDANWEDFRNLFDKVYKGFFIRLEKKLPGLSVSDTRLLSLVKLGLSNTEISNMMGMSVESIDSNKQRLREQIHPSKDGLAIEDLVQAI